MTMKLTKASLHTFFNIAKDLSFLHVLYEVCSIFKKTSALAIAVHSERHFVTDKHIQTTHLQNKKLLVFFL